MCDCIRLTLPSLPRSIGLAIAVLAFSVHGLGGCSKRHATDGGFSRAVERMRTAIRPSAVPRPLFELDATGDGRVSEADWKVFEVVAAAAGRGLGVPVSSLGFNKLYYAGIPEDSPSVFSLLKAPSGALDIEAVPRERLVELAIEARWMAAQARLASSVDGTALSRTFGGILIPRVNGYNADSMEPAAVCAAISQLDMGVFESSGLAAAAIFDLDSTVWAGNVSDAFLAVLAERRIPLPEANPPLQAYLKTLDNVDAAAVDVASVAENAQLLFARATRRDLPKKARVSAKDAFYNLVALLKGLPEATVDDAARTVFEEGSRHFPPWKDRVYDDRDGCGMRRIIQLLSEKGVQVYFLSATLDMLAWQGAQELGIARGRVLGSVLEIKNGHYTGNVAQSTYYTKGPLSRQWLPSPPLFAFGDSPSSDFAMLLEAAGVAFMVNPRQSLLERDVADADSRFVTLRFDATEAELRKAHDK